MIFEIMNCLHWLLSPLYCFICVQEDIFCPTNINQVQKMINICYLDLVKDKLCSVGHSKKKEG